MIKSIFTTTYSTLEVVAFCIWIGISAASVMMYLQKRVIGGFVRALLKAKALDPDSAKRTGELKLRMNGMIRRSLQNPYSSLRHTVMCVGEEPVNGKYPEKKKYRDISKVRFYIPKDKAFSAEERYSKKNTTLVVVLITVAVSYLLALGVVKYTDRILDLFRDSFANFGK